MSSALVCIVLQAFMLGNAEENGAHYSLLANFDWRLEQRSATNYVTDSPEGRAVLQEGVAILPDLIARFRAMDDPGPFVRMNYWALIQKISGVLRYAYSRSPRVVGAIDYYDPELDDLPPYHVDIGSAERYDHLADFFDLWDYLQSADNLEVRRLRLDATTGHVDPMAEDLTMESWRAYERALINYGIFNIPIFIESILTEVNPVAFAEFLRVTRHPLYLASDLKAATLSIRRVREAASELPEQEDRVALVIEWWAAHAEQFEAFPRLKEDIEASIRSGARE